MNSVIPTNPLFAPHLHDNPRLSPTSSDYFATERMSGKKRKASDDGGDDRMSTSPTSSPSASSRTLPHAMGSRSIKRARPASAVGRPLGVSRLLETLSPQEMRGLLETICEQNPAITHEVVTKAPRPSVEATLSVLNSYEAAFKESFPFGNRPSSDYTFNRVRLTLGQLIDALKDFTPHFLPPNEQQATVSLAYLDAVTNIVHRVPTFDTNHHNQAKQDAYDELSQAWASVIQEAAKKGGGFHLQFGSWDQKLLKHNELSGGRLQGAVNELRVSLGWFGGGQGPSSMASGGDDRAAVRQQILMGTYGDSALFVGFDRW